MRRKIKFIYKLIDNFMIFEEFFKIKTRNVQKKKIWIINFSTNFEILIQIYE